MPKYFLLLISLFCFSSLEAACPLGRSFLMGTTPFFVTTTTFPSWRFENMEDKDMISLHIDDFLGIPWSQFENNAPLPSTWEDNVQSLQAEVAQKEKLVYLSLSPLGGNSGRKNLSATIDNAGAKVEDWSTVVDSSGCYAFATDPKAEDYKTAYIAYAQYMIDLFQPRFFSPALEVSVTLNHCPDQATALKSWYTDVYNSLKQRYPSLPIFPTFQMEHMYGIGTVPCAGGLSYSDCYQQRLEEAVTWPMDRIAFSAYPIQWEFIGQFIPADTFSRVKALTDKPIWISETGWQAAHILTQSTPTCGTDLVPSSIANDTKWGTYMKWLLQEAETHHFEGVVWWLNRDFLDGPTAETCPCVGDAHTCALIQQFASVGQEFAIRLFANMGLRRFDGTARPDHSTWLSYLNRPLQQHQTLSSSGPQTLFLPAEFGMVSLGFSSTHVQQNPTVCLKIPSTFPTSPLSTIRGTNLGIEIETSQEGPWTPPLSLSMNYRESDVSGLVESQLAIARYDETLKRWVPLPSNVNPIQNHVTASLDHLSLFQLVQVSHAPKLSEVKAFPNPFKPSQGHQAITFSNLPLNSKATIYTIDRKRVKSILPDAFGAAYWNGRNEKGASVASGVYIVVVKSEGEDKKIKVVILP